MEKYVEMISPFTGGKVKEVRAVEEHMFRKETYSVHVRYYVCVDTGERFTTTDQDELMFNELYSQYRVRHGIPFPSEIKEIRERYGLNYSQMSKILGFGINQYAQYDLTESYEQITNDPHKACQLSVGTAHLNALRIAWIFYKCLNQKMGDHISSLC